MKNFKLKHLFLLSILVTIIPLSFFNVIYLVRAGIADAHTLAIRDQLSALRVSGKIPDPIAWANFHEELKNASDIMPDSPQYYEDMAYLEAVRGVSFLKFPEIADPNLKSAMANYRAALHMRPMAPATWANMALASYYLQKNNADTAHWFNLAAAYGASDPSTQIPLFFLAMQDWDHLAEVQKSQIKSVYLNARGSLKKDLTTILQQFHRQDFS